MGDRSSESRIKDFLEVDTGFTAAEAVLEAERCINCKKPQCIKGCPVNIDIPAFIELIAKKQFVDAALKIKEQNLLPAICGRVCPQETQCEEHCVLGKKETPVRIGQLERFAADEERKAGIAPHKTATKTGKKVAVVGSGPAGITAAGYLAKEGYDVTIFESLHIPGGVLTYGIPSFRLPKDIVKNEIDQILAMGVKLELNHLVGKSVSIDDLLSYDAVFLGSGAGLPHFMGIPGENMNGVYSANEFLTRVNLMHANNFPEYDTPVNTGNHVIVVGGGNVAMDSARTARRMGARVTLIYRRRKEDMPARLAEIHHAEEEGIEFICEANIVKIIGEQTITSVECVRMQMGEPDAGGRPVATPIEDSLFTIECDAVIMAIGQGPNPLLSRAIPGLTLGKAGNVITDDSGKTSLPKVFAGGDVSTGAATVILAMGGAKTAAKTICESFKKY